jgi:hypothetical protein
MPRPSPPPIPDRWPQGTLTSPPHQPSLPTQPRVTRGPSREERLVATMGREAYDNLQSRLRERHDRVIVDLRERFALPWQAGYTAPQPPLSRSLLAIIRDEQRWRENGVPGRIDVGGAWAARFDDLP